MTPPHESPHIAVRTRQRHLFQALLLGIVALIAVVMTVSVALVGVTDSTWRSLGILALLGIALALLRTGRFTPPVTLVIAVIMVASGRQLLESGVAQYGAALLPFSVAIAIAGVLLGRRALLITAALAVAWVVAVYLLEQRGVPWVAWEAPPDPAFDSVLLFVIVTIALVLVLERFGPAYKRALMTTAEREEELRLAASAAPLGVWSWDLASGNVEYSPEMKAMFGLPRDARPTVDTFLAHLHPDDRDRIAEATRIARQRGSDGLEELRIVRSDGTLRWIHSHSRTITNTRGEPVRVLGVVYDVTDDRIARERLALLEQAGRVMSESLNVQDTLDGLARILVPRLADWIVIDLAGDDGDFDRVVAFPDVGSESEAAEGSAGGPPVETSDMAERTRRVLRTLQAELVDATAATPAHPEPDRARRAIRGGERVGTAMSVPMVSRGRAVGVLTLGSAGSGRVYGETDVSHVAQIAVRAGIAVDNARLFQSITSLASTLEERVNERTRQVQNLVAEVTTAEARERHRIARLLHDELQQQLHAVHIMIQSVGAQRWDESDRAAIAEIDDALREAARLTRHLTTDLSPPTLESDNFAPVARWIAAQMRERHKLEVQVEAPHEILVPDLATRALLHTLIQELLFNVVKHADVREASLRLEERAGALRLTVSDRGAGFDPEIVRRQASGTGFGLAGAIERVEMFGGTLNVASTPGDGTRIQVSLPVRIPA